MRDDYLLVLTAGASRREVELSSDISLMRAGTTHRCDVRFRKELFFTEFELEFSQAQDGTWSVVCSKEVYISEDGVSRLAFKNLRHGDVAIVKYASSNATALRLSFAIDFERERGLYDRSIDLSALSALTIGGMQNCNLRLLGNYTGSSLITIERSEGCQFVLSEKASQYGVMHNGRRLSGSVTLKDCDFFSIANYYFYFKDRRLFFSKMADIAFNGVQYRDASGHCLTSDYPKFNRNTRIKTELDTEPVAVLDPPAKREPSKTNLIIQLLPAVGMLAIVVFLRGSLMQSASSQGFILISACSIGVGILASVLGIINEKRTYKKEMRERDEKYRAYIEQKRTEVRAFRQEEQSALARIYPSIEEGIAKTRTFSGDLFDRQPEDDDFLHIRLGAGLRESAKPVDFKEKESFDADELTELPRMLRDEFRHIPNAPVCIDADEVNAVGIVGPEGRCLSVMNNAVLDLCTRHFASDVRLFFVVEPEHETFIHWLRFMPHVQNELLKSRNIACDEESKNIVFEFLYKELTLREEGKGKRLSPRLVVFVVDECGLKNHPLSQFIGKASELGATFLFFERAKEYLPLGCDQIAFLDRDFNAGTLVDAHDGRKENRFEYEAVREADAAAVAMKLAPVYCEEVSLESALTKSISLFELLDIIAADDLDLRSRWMGSRVEKSLAAPLGVSKSKTIYLDLHDKAHGPHGLVAGTTGSGKSEILQTYVLAMATLFPPSEVGFVIIDFKGGGMANQFRDLPHLMGAITNIDGREIDRSLKSIKAELRKRQRCFAEAEVNHISNYIAKYKRGEVQQPIPHLIIIVDEFAELKAEQPDFMKELISAARIGRSLGVHLILATQKPAGQVSDQIWSNSRFKLCLKVQNQADSNEVLKSPLAAEIKEPGRAYLQVGNNEIFELFQSAYSGAPEHEDVDNTKEFSLFRVGESGKRTLLFEKKGPKSEEAVATQLEAVVDHVASYCACAGVPALPSICLPSLEQALDFPKVWSRTGMEVVVPLGVYDDPNKQAQGMFFLDVSTQNTFVVGSALYGKTNLLQGIIRGLAANYTPQEVNLYVIDCASGILRNFEPLRHVGGVVCASEDDKMKSLFKLLHAEVERRRAKLLEKGVSNHLAYREAGFDDLPQIVLLVDNLTNLRELYFQENDLLLPLCREGVTVGLSVVVVNAGTAGIGYKYLSSISSRVALYCNDSSEYNAVFDYCKMRPEEYPGRCIVEVNKEHLLCQTYLAFAGEREIDRQLEAQAFIKEVNAKYEGGALGIPVVPEVLSVGHLMGVMETVAGAGGAAGAGSPWATGGMVPLGIDYETVLPAGIDPAKTPILALVGDEKRAQAEFVAALLEVLSSAASEQPELYVVDGFKREFQSLARAHGALRYETEASCAEEVLGALHVALRVRRDMLALGEAQAVEEAPLQVLIVNNPDVLGGISASRDAMALFKDIVGPFKALGVLVLVMGFEKARLNFAAPEAAKIVGDAKQVVCFEPLAGFELLSVPHSTVRQQSKPLGDKDAFLVTEHDCRRLKLPSPQQRAGE